MFSRRSAEMIAAHSRIDEEVLSLLSKVAALNTRRNSLTFIAVLTAEVLAVIFWIALRPQSTDFISTPAKAIMMLGSVCRRWYAIVYENPRLWSQLELASDLCMQKMLGLSRNSLLELQVDVGSGGGQLAICGFRLRSPFHLVDLSKSSYTAQQPRLLSDPIT